jgi:hypothetical protein
MPCLIINRVSSIMLCAPSARYIHRQIVTAADSLSVCTCIDCVCVYVCTNTNTHTHTRTMLQLCGRHGRLYLQCLIWLQLESCPNAVCSLARIPLFYPQLMCGHIVRWTRHALKGCLGIFRGGGGGGHALEGVDVYIISSRHLQRICNHFNNLRLKS